ncbi:hypothetical protein BaRGS_00001460 [Batillaria attramentaria]|uniref:Uncharacterized protein n=1 Tax=Batillaria attramentaria TaxID=370345 RepID=A0ABD0M7P7_9CAEN
MEVSASRTPAKHAGTETTIQEKKKSSRGANCSLDIVWQYLKSGQCPKGYSKNDKRALKRRAQSFVVIKDQLYYTGGRSRHSNGDGEEETVENPENYPDYTQVLRKCCLTEDEKQDAVARAHVGEDGNEV